MVYVVNCDFWVFFRCLTFESQMGWLLVFVKKRD